MGHPNRPLGGHSGQSSFGARSQGAPGRRGSVCLVLALAALTPSCTVGLDTAALAMPREPCLGAPVGTAAPGGGSGPDHSRFDLCGNGLDDDHSGEVDEECACRPGETSSCYGGLPRFAGVGVCARGERTCVPEADEGRWGPCSNEGAPATEACGDGLDDNCDGRIDEACPCTLGDTQPCYPGPGAEPGVGPCMHGVQTCIEVGELDDLPIAGWSTCEGAVVAEPEDCDGVDDDCDGVVDDLVEVCNLRDDDCDAEIDEGSACVEDGMTPALTRFWPATASGLFMDASTPVHTLVATPAAPCPDGEILYEPIFGELTCVPLPPECPLTMQPVWSEADGWSCVPCDVVVQFGYLFDFERVCAVRPSLVCPSGQVPTFSETERHWICAPLCDNTDYDVVWADGAPVCVPC